MITHSVRALAWLYAIAILILSVGSPEFRPETGTLREFEHLMAFAILGVLFSLGHRLRWPLVLVIGTLFITTLEALQIWAPGRHARWADLVVNVAGFCVGLGVALVSQFMSRLLTR